MTADTPARDNLVERLRILAGRLINGDIDDDDIPCADLVEAADRIEAASADIMRLRERCDQLGRERDEAYERAAKVAETFAMGNDDEFDQADIGGVVYARSIAAAIRRIAAGDEEEKQPMTFSERAIEACARAMAENDSGPHGSAIFDIHWREFGKGYLEGSRTCLTAALAGSVVVPREPTWEMQIAGRDAIIDAASDDNLDVSTDDSAACYRAMIAAASPVTVQSNS